MSEIKYQFDFEKNKLSFEFDKIYFELSVNSKKLLKLNLNLEI